MPSPPASAPGTGRDSEALQDPNPWYNTRWLFHRTDSACPCRAARQGRRHPNLPTPPQLRWGKFLRAHPWQRLLLEEHLGMSHSTLLLFPAGPVERLGASHSARPPSATDAGARWQLQRAHPRCPHPRCPHPRCSHPRCSPPWQPQRAGRTTAFFPFPTIWALTAASESCSPSLGQDPSLALSPACAWLCRSSCLALHARGAQGNPQERPLGTNPLGRSAPAPAFQPSPAL